MTIRGKLLFHIIQAMKNINIFEYQLNMQSLEPRYKPNKKNHYYTQGKECESMNNITVSAQ